MLQVHRSLSRRGPYWPSGAPTTLGLLGDSTVNTSYLLPELQWWRMLWASTSPLVTNHAHDGSKTSDFLTGGAYPPSTWLGDELYLIRFGLNTDELNTTLFETNLLAVVDTALGSGADVVLATNFGVDFAGGHYNYDRDAWIVDFNAVVRDVATARGLPLIDLHALMAAEWDTRIRVYTIPGLPITDPRVWGNDYSAALDGDGFGGADDPDWYSDIHPNPRGCELIHQYTQAALDAEYL